MKEVAKRLIVDCRDLLANGKKLALQFSGLMRIFTLSLNLCTTVSTALVKWVSHREIRYIYTALPYSPFTQGWCLLDRDRILQSWYLGGLYYLLGGNIDLHIRFRVLS